MGGRSLVYSSRGGQTDPIFLTIICTVCERHASTTALLSIYAISRWKQGTTHLRSELYTCSFELFHQLDRASAAFDNSGHGCAMPWRLQVPTLKPASRISPSILSFRSCNLLNGSLVLIPTPASSVSSSTSSDQDEMRGRRTLLFHQLADRHHGVHSALVIPNLLIDALQLGVRQRIPGDLGGPR
jgi:hypothetical protein